jgi:DNA-binding phage protein
MTQVAMDAGLMGETLLKALRTVAHLRFDII